MLRRWILVAGVIGMCCCSVGFGQCDSTYQLMMMNPSMSYTIMTSDSTADTLDRRLIVPAHHLSFISDSTEVRLTYLEYRVNGRWVVLKDWCNERFWNWDVSANKDTVEFDNQELSRHTRTQTFPLHPSDTVSVVRRYYVFDAIGDSVSYSFSDQTIPAWAKVELVNAADSTILYTLDSIRFSAVNGKICVTGTRPALARAIYIHPSNGDSLWTFLRISLNSSGWHWHRHDALTGLMSDIAPSRVVLYNKKMDSANYCNQEATASVVSVSSLSAPLGIRISTTEQGTFTCKIFDLNGSLQSTHSVSINTTPVDVPKPAGLYYVVVSDQSGTVLGTHNVLVQ